MIQICSKSVHVRRIGGRCYARIAWVTGVVTLGEGRTLTEAIDAAAARGADWMEP